MFNQILLAGLACFITTASSAQEADNPIRGRAFAQQTCALCHGIQSGDHASPGVNTATFKTIANTPGMAGIALAVWLQTPHKSMPDLIIAQQDRNDVISYILTLRDAPAAK